MKGPLNNLNTKYIISSGLKVHIHNQSSSAEAVNVQMGKETNIGIKRTFSNKYPCPYSECVEVNSATMTENYRYIKYEQK